MTAGHPIDGTLRPWAEVRQAAPWRALLLGNGLSVNVWPGFAYESLYKSARSGAGPGALADDDVRLFRALDTTNFERVLADVKAAIRVSRASGQDPRPFEQRYRRIQGELGKTIRAAHAERSLLPNRTLRQIRGSLLGFRWVFTTSYDLLVYWAMGHGETFDGFCDCFWSNGRNEFDAQNAAIWDGVTPVLFLHGALHLIVGGNGMTRKLTRDDRMLLAQFGHPIPGDPDARPLLVTEGSSQDKRRVIGANEYLRFALDRLSAQPHPLVIFGHSLSVIGRAHV